MKPEHSQVVEIKGKTALVTGGAKRIGKALAIGLAQTGCNIAVHYGTSRDDAENVASEIRKLGRQCWTVQSDLADPDSISAMLESLNRDTPPIDVLINSASVYYETPFQTLTLQQWDANLHVNLRAPFQLAQSLGQRMFEQGYGKIINISDCSVKRPYRGHLPYFVSKSGLVALTELLALELAPAVQVNTIAPGTVLLPENAPDTMREQSVRRAPLKRLGSPDDVVSMALHLILHGDFMTGGYYAVDGGAGIRG